MNKVEYNYITGVISVVLPNIKRSLGQYIRNYEEVKIGITGRNPQIRFNEHQQRRDWDRMIVKYRTTSQNNANKVEKYFIECYPNLANYWIGNTQLSYIGHNYVYFLLYRKKIK